MVLKRAMRGFLRSRFAMHPEHLIGRPPIDGAKWTAAAPVTAFGATPTARLIDVGLRAAETAAHVRLDAIAERAPTSMQRTWVNQWPGEHYRLLTALCRNERVGLAVEVGTFTGLGALALAEGAERVVTYDIVPWRDTPDPVLGDDDFDRIEQRIGDLSDQCFFDSQADTLHEADLVFVDGPKDGVFEPAFLPLLRPVLRIGALLVLDDILFLSMLRVWRDLPLPKWDITSLGHWSGTGIAEAVSE